MVLRKMQFVEVSDSRPVFFANMQRSGMQAGQYGNSVLNCILMQTDKCKYKCNTNTNVSTDTNTHTRYFIRNAGQSVWNSILKCMLMHSLEATLSCRLLIYFSGVIYSKSKLQQLLSTNVCPVVEVPANFDSGKNPARAQIE